MYINLCDFEINDLRAEIFVIGVKPGSPKKPHNKMKIQVFWRMTPCRLLT
jgi:hypothetical protein